MVRAVWFAAGFLLAFIGWTEIFDHHMHTAAASAPVKSRFAQEWFDTPCCRVSVVTDPITHDRILCDSLRGCQPWLEAPR